MSNSTVLLTDGWQHSPTTRGTIDIVWSSISTVFLCLWTMVHLNLPAPTDGYWTIFWRKFRWLLLGVLAPELPMLLACGQWSSAKRSVQKMRELGFEEDRWSMTHAFFADSGGIWLQMPGEESFPATAKQLAWLIEHKAVKLPAIKREDIKDKSNADMVAKAITATQTAWFITQIIARAAKDLPIVPLELTSAALALTSLTTLWFWLEKPMDAHQPYLLEVDCDLSMNFHDSKSTKAYCEETASESSASSMSLAVALPLDEIEPGVYISRKWSRRLLSFILHTGLQKPRMNRIPNDRDPQVFGFRQHLILGISTAAFASIHFKDWHFSFATKTELLIWRTNCCVMFSLLAVYGSAEVYMCWRDKYQKLGMDTAGGYKMRWPTNLAFLIPASIYFCARLILIVGVFVNLRSLPVEAYRQVEWSTVLPHF